MEQAWETLRDDTKGRKRDRRQDLEEGHNLEEEEEDDTFDDDDDDNDEEGEGEEDTRLFSYVYWNHYPWIMCNGIKISLLLLGKQP